MRNTIVVSLALFVFWPVLASAEVPDTFTYTGTLKKDGAPYDGMVSATFALYDSETGGTQVWSETHPTLQVRNGQFVAELGAENPFDSAFDGKDLWLAITVNGTTLSPRNHLGSLPYAHRAETADNAEQVGGMDVSEIETAVQDVDASNVSYDNSTSELSASNTQDAIDEIAALRQEIESLRSKLDDKADKSTLQDDYATKSDLQSKADRSTVQNKADASSVYTKSEADSQFATTSALQSKADKTTVQDKADASSVYTKSEADSTFATNSELQSKADTSNVYTRSEADSTFLSDVELGDYYKKSTVDTKLSDKADTSQLTDLEDKTQDISRTTINGTQSLVFNGVNVHVRNGQGSTDSTNGAGNLVVGYNDSTANTSDTDEAAGSHNIVVGDDHSHTQNAYGGVLVGFDHETSAKYASVSGGYGNTATDTYASVTGGKWNDATANLASVSGGKLNTASGENASVSGGLTNTASGVGASVSGGTDNETTSNLSSISGGKNNLASDRLGSVSGGEDNTASGQSASICGGLGITISSAWNWGGDSQGFVQK